MLDSLTFQDVHTTMEVFLVWVMKYTMPAFLSWNWIYKPRQLAYWIIFPCALFILGPVHTNVVIRFQTKTELVCLSFSYSFRPSTLQRRICFENAFAPSVRMLKWIAQYSNKAHGRKWRWRPIRPWGIFFCGGPGGCPQKDAYRKLDFFHYPISNAFCRAQWINSRL